LVDVVAKTTEHSLHILCVRDTDFIIDYLCVHHSLQLILNQSVMSLMYTKRLMLFIRKCSVSE